MAIEFTLDDGSIIEFNSIIDNKVVYSKEPNVYTIDNLVSKEECQHIIREAKPRLGRAKVGAGIDPNNIDGTYSTSRTGSNCWFSHNHDPIFKRIGERISKKVGQLAFQPFNADRKNIIVVGPLPGKKYSDMVFPILSPSDPKSFQKFPVQLGGNRGRGQVYPDGSRSNNTVYNSPFSGQITSIETGEKGENFVTIKNESKSTTETIPAGPQLLVKVGDSVNIDEPLTNNPNVGGFGQADGELVLQNPLRIEALIAFLGTVVIAQVFLVLKKKQFEKVQLSDMNF